jgi:Tfp pilus assembly protein FimV
MSNSNNMRRSAPRAEVAAKQVKSAWHQVRSRKASKDAEGNRTITMAPGLSLKQWAKEQVKNNTTMASLCEQWLLNKTL